MLQQSTTIFASFGHWASHKICSLFFTSNKLLRQPLMRSQCTSAVPPHTLNITLHTICDIDRLPILSPKGTIRQILSSFRRSDNPSFRHPICINYKDRSKTGMADKQTSFFIHSQSIWSSTTERLEEQPRFWGGAISVERQSPDSVGTSHSHV